jgi:signal peptidase I
MTMSLIRVARRAVGLVEVTLFVTLIGLTLFIHLAPLTGRQLFIIGGGSMEPSIPIGSLVVVSPIGEMTVAAGDVVTVRADNGVVVTHRVSRVLDLPEGRSFEMKGDANQAADGGVVPSRAIVGAATHYVPLAGYAQTFLSTVPGILAAVAVLGALLFTYLFLEMLESSYVQTRSEDRQPVGP